MAKSSWLGGSGDWSDPSKWSPSVPNSATTDATISASNTGTVTIASGESFTADDVSLNASGATLDISGTLNLAGTLSEPEGKLKVEATGTIAGGTVMGNSKYSVYFGSAKNSVGTLDGVQWRGDLNIDSGSALGFKHGFDVLASDGTNPGTITVENVPGQADGTADIDFLDAATVDNVTFKGYDFELNSIGHTTTVGANVSASLSGGFVGLNGSFENDGNLNSSFVLTLKANLVNFGTFQLIFLTNAGTVTNKTTGVLDGSGFSNSSINTLSNAGTVDLSFSQSSFQSSLTIANVANQSGAHFDVSGIREDVFVTGSFVNDGTIDMTGGQLLIEGSLKNSGEIDVSNGSTIGLGSELPDVGTLEIQNSTFILYGTYDGSFVAQYSGMEDTVGIGGKADNAGQTLSFSAETVKGELFGGTIKGGVIQNADDNSFVADGGTLDGVTFEGDIVVSAPTSPNNVSTPVEGLRIKGGLTVSGVDGTGTGQITVSSGDYVTFEGTQTLDHTVVVLSISPPHTLPNASISARGGTLTLGPDTIVESQAGKGYPVGALIDGTSVVNEGTIEGSLVVAPHDFTNDGTLLAQSGNMYVTSLDFTNLSGTDLTGGSYEADSNSLLYLGSHSRIDTDAADITLDNVGSGIGTKSGGQNFHLLSIDTYLENVTTDGSLHVLDGRGFSGTNDFTDDGLVDLEGGTFKETRLTVGADGTFTGFGVISTATVENDGALRAKGGALEFGGHTSGVGTYKIGDNATLRFDQALDMGSNIDFDGASGSLALGQSDNPRANISGFAEGDVIDLTGTAADSLSYARNTGRLVVKDGATTMDVFTLAGTYNADGFALAQSGGDTHITYNAPAQQALASALFDAAFSPAAGSSLTTVDPNGHAAKAPLTAADHLTPHIS